MSGPLATSETTAEPNLAGRTLGDYRIDHRLGWGGMAVVYLAQQKTLGRPVALKVLRQALASDAKYVRRFINEAQAAAKLVHSNIVQIYEVGCIDGIHFIAQEYVPGQNLKQLLSQHPTGLPVEQAMQLTWQIAMALQKAADQQITHRDIKPENILLTDQGEAKVADFGLARIAADKNVANLTQVGITMGTPLYMSPEQVEGKDIGPSSDLYSLGITLYEMLTGRPPFLGETALAIAVQHLKSVPPTLEKHPRVQKVPALWPILERLLAKEPERRYGHPRHLLADLRTIVGPGLTGGLHAEHFNWRPPSGAQPVAKFEATQQLNVLLKTREQAIVRMRPMAGWQLAAIALLALAIGGTLAWFTRPKPLLAWNESEMPAVPRFESASEQWHYARFAKTNVEQAWLAIAQYHPPGESGDNLLYSRRATAGLANWYLSQGKYDQALPAYESLAALNNSQFAAISQAGQAVVFHRQGKDNQARALLAQVYPNRDKLDEYLRRELEILATKYGNSSLKETSAS